MIRKICTVLPAVAMLAACSVADRVASVGRPPKFSKVHAVPSPSLEPSLAHGGAPMAVLPPSSASLFRPGAADLFSDQRARQRGDILTIRVNVADKAAFSNATERSRGGNESASLAALLGIDRLIDRVLPGKQGGDIEADSRSRSTGKGSTARSETIDMALSAVVTDVLPNGNLLIRGRQELRVNFELRELVVTGYIRPQDIARDNSIRHDRIAEARVSYGGRGHLTDAQQARYGQQIYDALFPF